MPRQPPKRAAGTAHSIRIMPRIAPTPALVCARRRGCSVRREPIRYLPALRLTRLRETRDRRGVACCGPEPVSLEFSHTMRRPYSDENSTCAIRCREAGLAQAAEVRGAPRTVPVVRGLPVPRRGDGYGVQRQRGRAGDGAAGARNAHQQGSVRQKRFRGLRDVESAARGALSTSRWPGGGARRSEPPPRGGRARPGGRRAHDAVPAADIAEFAARADPSGATEGDLLKRPRVESRLRHGDDESSTRSRAQSPCPECTWTTNFEAKLPRRGRRRRHAARRRHGPRSHVGGLARGSCAPAANTAHASSTCAGSATLHPIAGDSGRTGGAAPPQASSTRSRASTER